MIYDDIPKSDYTPKLWWSLMDFGGFGWLLTMDGSWPIFLGSLPEIVPCLTGQVRSPAEVTVREEDCLSSKILGHFSAGSHLQAR